MRCLGELAAAHQHQKPLEQRSVAPGVLATPFAKGGDPPTSPPKRRVPLLVLVGLLALTNVWG
eukprot:6179909-Pyramimonas_sp.AAC.1